MKAFKELESRLIMETTAGGVKKRHFQTSLARASRNHRQVCDNVCHCVAGIGEGVGLFQVLS
jgi:hypothetical protein